MMNLDDACVLVKELNIPHKIECSLEVNSEGSASTRCFIGPVNFTARGIVKTMAKARRLTVREDHLGIALW